MPRFIRRACASALFLAAGAAPAIAQERESRVVSYADLNLNSPVGADHMIRRIERASDVVCGERDGPVPVVVSQNIQECTYETADNAVADLDHPVVTSRYLYGTSPEVIIEDPDDHYDPALKGSK